MQILRNIILILSVNISTSYTKTIIWDLGGVLFEPSTYRVLSHIGFMSLIKHILHDRRYPALKEQVFTLLHQLELDLELDLELECSILTNNLYDSTHTLLPVCMNAWLTGALTGIELITHAHKRIEELHIQEYFTSKHEKNLLKRAISALFHPLSFTHSMRPVKAGLRLLKKCARIPHNRLLLLSNWDAQSFEILAQSRHSQRVLRYFKPEHRVISGTIGYAKPDQRCFEYIIKKYNLHPQECIFIDDQYENTLQAEKQGFTGIWLQNKNYTALEHLLKLHNIL